MIPTMAARPEGLISLWLPCDMLLAVGDMRSPKAEPALIRILLQLLPALIRLGRLPTTLGQS